MPSARKRSLRQLTGANHSPRKLSFTTIKEARVKLRSTASTAGHAIKTFVRPITALMVEEKTQPQTAASHRSPPPKLNRSTSLSALRARLRRKPSQRGHLPAHGEYPIRRIGYPSVEDNSTPTLTSPHPGRVAQIWHNEAPENMDYYASQPTHHLTLPAPPLARSNSLPSLSVKLIKDVTAKAKTAGEKMRHSTSFEGLGQRQLVKDATSTLKATGQRFRNSTSFEGLREKFTGLGLNPMESIQEEEQDLRPCQKAYLRSQNRSTTTDRSTSITPSTRRDMMSMAELHSDDQRASFPRRTPSSTTTTIPPRGPIDRTSITTLALSPPHPTPAAILLHQHNTQTMALLSILQTLRHAAHVPFLTLSPSLSSMSLTLARHCIDWQTATQRARPQRTLARVVTSMRLVVLVGPAGVSAADTGKAWRDHPGWGRILRMAWFTTVGMGQREGRWVVVLMLDEEDLWRGLREREVSVLEVFPFEEEEEEEEGEGYGGGL